MYQIQTLNKISHIGLDVLGDDYTIGNEVANPDAILVRSAAMHEMELPATLKAIARAGAGVNNIPIDRCTEQGIVVFNTPGANANAVKELVIAGLLISCLLYTSPFFMASFSTGVPPLPLLIQPEICITSNSIDRQGYIRISFPSKMHLSIASNGINPIHNHSMRDTATSWLIKFSKQDYWSVLLNF